MNNDEQKSAVVVPLKGKTTEKKCPNCAKPATAQYRPFCSKRCADIDLGHWLKEDYRVPVEDQPDEFEDDQ